MFSFLFIHFSYIQYDYIQQQNNYYSPHISNSSGEEKMYGHEHFPKHNPTSSHLYSEHSLYRMECSNNSSYYPGHSDDSSSFPNCHFQYYQQDREIDWNQNNTSLHERRYEFNNDDNKGSTESTTEQCCEFYRSSQARNHNGNPNNIPTQVNESYCQLSYPQFD